LKFSRSMAMAVMLLVALTACHHTRRELKPAVDPELLKLSKEQVFQRGEESYNHRKWGKARTYYSFLYENYPNDPLGRRALLRVADTYFQSGDPVSLVEAQYKYRDFINRYPGSEYGDYAMLQIAQVSVKQIARAERDQAKTHEAVEKLNDMIRAYPNSKYRPEAEKLLALAQDRLAKHEHVIARFYMKRRDYNAALGRLNYIVEKFPNFAERDAAFFDLGKSLDQLGRKGEARLYFERVVSEFPSSRYAREAKQLLDRIKA
jgi:outer membrane protein assembly factor BamD